MANEEKILLQIRAGLHAMDRILKESAKTRPAYGQIAICASQTKTLLHDMRSTIRKGGAE